MREEFALLLMKSKFELAENSVEANASSAIRMLRTSAMAS